MNKLKDKIEKNIFISILTICFTVISGVFFVINYFYTQEMNLVEKSHIIEKTRITNEYNSKIADLEFRLMSIKRIVNLQTEYQDVSSFSITSSMIKSLDDRFKPYSKQRIYVNTPLGAEWSHKSATMLYFTSLISGEKINPNNINTSIKNFLGMPIELWSSSQHIDVRLESEGLLGKEIVKLTLHPYVLVRVIDNESLKAFLSGFSWLYDDQIKIKYDDALISAANIFESKKERPRKNIAEYVQSKQREQSIATFDKILKEDLASLFVQAEFSESNNMSYRYKGVSSRFNSIQKQGSVLYMQLQTKFFESESVKINNGHNVVYLDKEVFFIGGNDYSVAIQISIPSYDGRAKEYAWVSEWLAGFHAVADHHEE